ncbi:hypothetical protein [uncultured Aquimarina sp.]|uniref:hypothetical protein n=1 Tax=uncultured Aquimarina sp. TaxID=575652 RepID=UPI00260D7C3A|nr:hypothetical protein [uncultured Aquimarina sp.]
MLKHKRTYNNNLISSWFFTLLLFFGIAGYANYTPPTAGQTKIELVVSNEEDYSKTLLYRAALSIKQHFGSYNSYLKQISEHHTTISLIRTRDFDNAIPLDIIHKVFHIRSTNYSAEDDSFHLG